LPGSNVFPYTTLFRSHDDHGRAAGPGDAAEIREEGKAVEAGQREVRDDQHRQAAAAEQGLRLVAVARDERLDAGLLDDIPQHRRSEEHTSELQSREKL